MSDGMAGPSRFEIRRVIFHIHVNCALQAKLPVFDHDRVFVLGNPIHGPIESPIEDDAGCLAMESRIVLALERCGRFFSGLRQFATTIQARTGCWTTAAGACSAGIGWPLAPFVLAQLVELHHWTARATWIYHHRLHRSPIAGDVELTCWSSQKTLGNVRCDDRTTNLLQAPFWRFDVLTVPIHTSSVRR